MRSVSRKPRLRRSRSRVALMSVLGAVVESSTAVDEDVFKVCQFSNRSFRGRGASLLVAHDLAWHAVTRDQNLLEKPLGCGRVATLLQPDFQCRAMRIDCSP
jgi:hypothetical protein